MAPKSGPLVLAILSVMAVAALGLTGGWEPIQNLKEGRVIPVAHYAVAAYNKEELTSLSLVSVLKAEKQIVAGVNYRLVLSAKDSAAAAAAAAAPVHTYTAVVFVPLSANKPLNLTSFVQN